MSKLINAKVAKTSDVSEIVLNYIITQTENDEPPFELQKFATLRKLREPHLRKSNACGWRALINLQEKKMSKEAASVRRRKVKLSSVGNTMAKPESHRNCKKKTFSVG
jgi:hypothetical protein